jgi:hypothetical protein
MTTLRQGREVGRRRWWDRGAIIALAWLSAHLLTLLIWHEYSYTACCDVHYYWSAIAKLHQVGAANTLREYPTPVIWIMQVPWLLARGDWTDYHRWFQAMMAATDAAFAFALWRAGGKRRAQTLAFWIAFPLLLGPIAYTRFDMLPAVLVGGALLALGEQRHRVSGALTGIGAAIKLWPAALWPVLVVSQRKGRLRATAWFLGAGAVLALASIRYAGLQRLLSPLQWQEKRGLQIESIWATVPMAWRGFQPRTYPLTVRFGAWEIDGPGVHIWMTVASLATVLAIVAIAVAYIVWLLRGRHTHLEAGLFVLLVIAVLIVSNKALSTQYILWLGPPTAALISMLGQDDPHGESLTPRQVGRIAGMMLVIALLTEVIFPRTYHPLTYGGDFFGLATAVLVLRNVALLVFTFELGGTLLGRLRAAVEH